MHTRLFVSSLLLASQTAGAQPQVDVVEPVPAPQPVAKIALEIEPGVATALTDPQSLSTDPGLGQTFELLFGVTRYLEVGPTAAFTKLRSKDMMPSSDTVWAFGGGARLMRPHDGRTYLGMSPWVDADLLYVHAGPLDRPGFAAAAGLAIPLDHQRQFWIGPYARYFQVLQGDPSGTDNRDAKILDVGISLEVGLAFAHRRESTPSAVAVAAQQPAPVLVFDRDHDGVADDVDNCPDAAGPAEHFGCPVYDKVVVLPDKLQLSEKIGFAWNSAELDADSRPLLDEVAKALNDNVGFTVKVNGNASSEGDDAHNQVLSEQRATAVLDYLAAHGVAKDRLASQGFSSSVPAASNGTAAGRSENRRVEFVVEFIIVKK